MGSEIGGQLANDPAFVLAGEPQLQEISEPRTGTS